MPTLVVAREDKEDKKKKKRKKKKHKSSKDKLSRARNKMKAGGMLAAAARRSSAKAAAGGAWKRDPKLSTAQNESRFVAHLHALLKKAGSAGGGGGISQAALVKVLDDNKESLVDVYGGWSHEDLFDPKREIRRWEPDAKGEFKTSEFMDFMRWELRLMRIFRKLDSDGDGSISLEQMDGFLVQHPRFAVVYKLSPPWQSLRGMMQATGIGCDGLQFRRAMDHTAIPAAHRLADAAATTVESHMRGKLARLHYAGLRARAEETADVLVEGDKKEDDDDAEEEKNDEGEEAAVSAKAQAEARAKAEAREAEAREAEERKVEERKAEERKAEERKAAARKAQAREAEAVAKAKADIEAKEAAAARAAAEAAALAIAQGGEAGTGSTDGLAVASAVAIASQAEEVDTNRPVPSSSVVDMPTDDQPLVRSKKKPPKGAVQDFDPDADPGTGPISDSSLSAETKPCCACCVTQ